MVKWRKDRYEHRHPIPSEVILLIEVADSTLRRDRGVKSKMYAQADIQEYWIVDIPNQQVEIRKLPKQDTFQSIAIKKKGQVAECEQLQFSVKVDDLF